MCIRDRRNVLEKSAVYLRKPVSYTHLDVYKRQKLTCGRVPEPFSFRIMGAKVVGEIFFN